MAKSVCVGQSSYKTLIKHHKKTSDVLINLFPAPHAF